jgi:hypothetical protein
MVLHVEVFHKHGTFSTSEKTVLRAPPDIVNALTLRTNAGFRPTLPRLSRQGGSGKKLLGKHLDRLGFITVPVPAGCPKRV